MMNDKELSTFRANLLASGDKHLVEVAETLTDTQLWTMAAAMIVAEGDKEKTIEMIQYLQSDSFAEDMREIARLDHATIYAT